ncbi:MAG: hypothetical protein AB7P03_22365 [Kofleriaceae bacterium]
MAFVGCSTRTPSEQEQTACLEPITVEEVRPLAPAFRDARILQDLERTTNGVALTLCLQGKVEAVVRRLCSELKGSGWRCDPARASADPSTRQLDAEHPPYSLYARVTEGSWNPASLRTNSDLEACISNGETKATFVFVRNCTLQGGSNRSR